MKERIRHILKEETQRKKEQPIPRGKPFRDLVEKYGFRKNMDNNGDYYHKNDYFSNEWFLVINENNCDFIDNRPIREYDKSSFNFAGPSTAKNGDAVLNVIFDAEQKIGLEVDISFCRKRYPQEYINQVGAVFSGYSWDVGADVPNRLDFNKMPYDKIEELISWVTSFKGEANLVVPVETTTTTTLKVTTTTTTVAPKPITYEQEFYDWKNSGADGYDIANKTDKELYKIYRDILMNKSREEFYPPVENLELAFVKRTDPLYKDWAKTEGASLSEETKWKQSFKYLMFIKDKFPEKYNDLNLDDYKQPVASSDIAMNESLRTKIKNILVEETSKPLLAIRRRTDMIDDIFPKIVDDVVYRFGFDICQMGEPKIFIETVTDALAESLYWTYFSTALDDDVEQWDIIYKFIIEYVEDKYGEQLTQFFRANCGNK